MLQYKHINFDSNIVQVFSFGICEQQIKEKVRQYSFSALLQKHMSWFDQPENSVSILTHRLAVEAENISHVRKLYNTGSQL